CVSAVSGYWLYWYFYIW
nr:immunoglobulin heavy chain junction region [Macaca mulatta]MOW81796.1 immunoglobulin heavy chain junction region [Macaca mulatta]MOW81820.1 immunoglobulin heavy chain junction region [Macaca mulatta]MOW82257.1 immunoglobulin heavy chain junction region [Macaca mulatta]MOW82270.1 immunoglobulin heavy chain junction region [Macaca mulatta]